VRLLIVRLGTFVLAVLVVAAAAGCRSPFRTVSLVTSPEPSSSSPPAVGLALDPPSPSPSASAAPAPAVPSSTPRPVRSGAGPAPMPVPSATPHVVNGVLVGSRQQELTNQARAAAGLAALAWNQCLADVASRHALEMAAAGRIYHGGGVDQDLACGLGSHQTGENVGDTSGGADDQRIFDAFMKSSGHRANILGPYRFVATAWVIGADGTGYVSVEFG
jgi:uncharacterized protein YkwD